MYCIFATNNKLKCWKKIEKNNWLLLSYITLKLLVLLFILTSATRFSSFYPALTPSLFISILLVTVRIRIPELYVTSSIQFILTYLFFNFKIKFSFVFLDYNDFPPTHTVETINLIGPFIENISLIHSSHMPFPLSFCCIFSVISSHWLLLPFILMSNFEIYVIQLARYGLL